MNTKENIARANKVREIRKLIGITQAEQSKEFKLKQPNYNKMERGFARMPEYFVQHMRNKYDLWKRREILALKGRIDYLNNV